jgi:hypothetical protein
MELLNAGSPGPDSWTLWEVAEPRPIQAPFKYATERRELR